MIAFASAVEPLAGLEFEFATVGMLDAKWGKAHEDVAKALLGEVQKLDGGAGTIQVIPWSKNKDLTEVVFTDSKRRKWAFTPESLNTTGLDGLEFVTPPLESDVDLGFLDSILAKFKDSKKLMRGIRSSMHVTVDIRHLISGQDADQVVERILYIENNWSEIYRTLRPSRYGVVVNRFAVPLASDQQGLLKKLAAMPKSERTFAKVRQVFMSFDAAEEQLRNADGTRAIRKWKYRAGNYSKLFSLQGDRSIPVFEFRVSDMDYGLNVREKVKFLKEVVTRDIPRQTFEAPFGNHVLTPAQANLRMKEILGIDDPGLQNIELHDLDEPLSFNGKNVSMGFEAEFRSEKNPFVTTSGGLDKQKFPFLDPKISTEGTGNTEVRSIGGEWRLGEVLDEMRLVKSKLNGTLRGFHFHMFVPKESVPPELEERFKGWMAYIGDTMVGWRLQNKKHFFALKTWSNGRVDPNDLESRSTLRMQDADDFHDIELRGYMGSEYDIGQTIQKILTGLKNPELIPPAMADYTKHFESEMPTDGFVKELEKFSEIFHGRGLSTAEKEALSKLTNEDFFKNVLPVYRLQNSQVFDAYQRRTLRDAHQNFLKETLTVIKNEVAGKYSETPEDFEKNFRFRVKRWAESFDYYSMMQSNMLLDSKGKIGQLARTSGDRVRTLTAKVLDGSIEFEDAIGQIPEPLRRDFEIEILNSERGNDVVDYYVRSERIPDDVICANFRRIFSKRNTTYRAEILDALRLNPNAENVNFVQGLLESRFSAKSDYYGEALQFLAPFEDNRTVALFKKLTAPGWGKVRTSWAAVIGTRTDAATFEIIKSAVASSDLDLQRAALRAIASRRDAGGLEVLRPFLSGRNAELKALAITALGFKSEPEVVTILEKFLSGRSEAFRSAAITALEDSTAPGAVDLILTRLIAEPNNYQYRSMVSRKQSKEWAEKLVAYYRLRTTPKSVKEVLVTNMGKLQDSESLSILKKLSGAPNGLYRSEAMNALYARSDADSRALLHSYLRDPSFSDYHYWIRNSLGDADSVVGDTGELGAEPARTVQEYLRRNGTLRGVPCQLLLN
jgi:HEAT repeat protein